MGSLSQTHTQTTPHTNTHFEDSTQHESLSIPYFHPILGLRTGRVRVAGEQGLIQYVYRKEGRWMSYRRPEATDSTTAPDLTGLLAEELGLCTPSRSGSVCLSASVSVLLILPLSQRILFSTTQMFGAVCCAALSCVYKRCQQGD